MRQRFGLDDVRRFAVSYVGAEPGGRASPAQASELQALEGATTFSRTARAEFEALLARLGVASSLSIGLPLNDEPFWFRDGHPLAGFRSHGTLPTAVDTLIVGAGLVGASTAYHLVDAVQREGRRVAVIDRGDPAGEASGRNAGNFEMIPENSVGLYEGLARERFLFLRRRFPRLPIEVLGAEAERQASVVLDLSLRNRQRFRDIVLSQGIVCDFAPRGWLFLAHTEQQEQGICEEAMLAARHGELIELWSRGKIRNEFAIETPTSAGSSPETAPTTRLSTCMGCCGARSIGESSCTHACRCGTSNRRVPTGTSPTRPRALSRPGGLSSPPMPSPGTCSRSCTRSSQGRAKSW